MRSALLRGRDHVELDAIDVVGEGPVAIAISRGGAAKTYPYTDPNEDVCAFALGCDGWMLAVADGHSGFEASEVVIEHLLANPAPHWTDGGSDLDAEWKRHAVAALYDANDEVVRERMRGIHLDSATTLCTALIRPAEGHLLVLGVGDSHVFTVDTHGDARELAPGGKRPTWFLGTADESAERLARRCRIESHRLDDTHAVVCVTDGLSEVGIGVEDPAAAIAEAAHLARAEPPGLRPMRLAREVCQLACDAQRDARSGDNVAVSVAWLREPDR